LLLFDTHPDSNGILQVIPKTDNLALFKITVELAEAWVKDAVKAASRLARSDRSRSHLACLAARMLMTSTATDFLRMRLPRIHPPLRRTLRFMIAMFTLVLHLLFLFLLFVPMRLPVPRPSPSDSLPGTVVGLRRRSPGTSPCTRLA
jgi:hypothetical protein